MVAVGLIFTPTDDPCADVGLQLDGVWDEFTRVELMLHVDALEASHVEESRERVFSALDAWSDAWLAERVSTCTALNGPDRSQDLEQRSRNVCLTGQLGRARMLVDRLATGDANALAEGIMAAHRLGDPRACADELAQLGVEPPAPSMIASVEAIRAQLEQAQRWRRDGRNDALSLLESLEHDAEELGYAPVLAEVRGELARTLAEGRPRQAAGLYDSAIDLAEAHNHARLAAELLIERAELSLHEMQEFDQAELRLRWATATSARADMDDEMRARLAFGRGRLLQYQEQLEQADRSYREALALSSADSPARPAYLDARADVVSQSDPAAGLELRRESLELARALFGSRHPYTAKRLYNLGAALRALGLDGHEQLELAASIWIEAGDDRWVAKANLHFGESALAEGQLDEAEAFANTAAKRLARALPESHPEHGAPEQLLAVIESVRGNHEAAITHQRAALASFAHEAKGHGVDPRVCQMRSELANSLLSLGRYDEARAELTILLRSNADSSPWSAIGHLRLAEIALRLGELDEADLQLRTVRTSEAPLGPEEVTYTLLQALVDQRLGRPNEKAVAALTRARARYPELSLDAWLDDLDLSSGERLSLELSPLDTPE